MNTNQLKRFAQEARIKLLKQVEAKLSFVLTSDTPELREKTEQVKQLKDELNKTGKAQLIEKVAYTWFNRLMALRFMDANDYQPLGIRVITPKDEYTTPELLDEAKRGNIPDELKLNRQKVFDLLDSRIPSTNPQNEAYKELLIAACNHLNTVFPFLFEKISDYSELLLPDDLTSDFSIVTDVRNGILIEDCSNVEIIGWLYQFYISEKKDEVFASKSAVKKEDIPAATQLFTPRWIVEYMVQNTVGKLWLQNRPKSRLREHMPYFIESPSLSPSGEKSEGQRGDDYLKIASPEEIRLLDPASGSGHILVYGFDLLTKIYEEEGYQTSEIPKLIIEKNLHGFEIDERAAQLSGFALMMKAVESQRRSLRKNIIPNILCFKDLRLADDEINNAISELQLTATDELISDLKTMQQATNFGSLITPKTRLNDLQAVFDKLEKLKLKNNLFQKAIIDELSTAVGQLIKLSPMFHCVVANPPYMGGGNMNKELSEFVKKYYSDSKSDLFSCFIERSLILVPQYGFNGLVTMESWMFLSSFEKFRKKLIDNVSINVLTHFGWHIMRIAFGTVSFILEKKVPPSNFQGTYSYMGINNIDKITERPKVYPVKDNGRYKIANQKDFEKIPGSPIGYWLVKEAYEIFANNKTLKSVAYPRQGLATTNNELFLRHWFEVQNLQIGFNLNKQEAIKSIYKWFPINKGGSFRKWYGNNHFIINFENDGKTICEYIDNTPGVKVKSNGRVINRDKYFSEGLTWSTISSSNFAMRYSPIGSIFETKGGMCFCEDLNLLMPILGYLNTKIVEYFLKAISPTLDFHEGPLGRLPVIINNSSTNLSIIDIVTGSILISRIDWDARETSWDFHKNELIRIKGQDLEESYDLYQQYWSNKFFQLHKNEEELNRQFIEIYGLQDELTPDVPLEDITILKEETSIVNGQLVFNANEVFAQFMSYSVGCMFGRYSLDKEGLILANQGETVEDYLHKIERTLDTCSFLPDADNIIPVLDDEWFEDDIVARFHKFLKVTFGEANFSKNLAFVEEKLGKDIRKYFTKDFYSDHIKRYKKRPIYWMFSSPKGSFNVLIYMHRYTPDTVSNILNKYLREFSGKLKTRLETLEHIKVSGTASEKTKAIKESDSIDKMLIDLHEYERDILYPIATERIAIDLDDGVLVNYNKFGKAIKEVTGLNDKATKKKVKEFDWIDATQIR